MSETTHATEFLAVREGQMVTIDEACRIDHRVWALSWKPSNTARVTRRHQDVTGMVRCSSAATCHRAEQCLSGRWHRPTSADAHESLCMDYRPYHPGGVRVHAVAADPEPARTLAAVTGREQA